MSTDNVWENFNSLGPCTKFGLGAGVVCGIYLGCKQGESIPEKIVLALIEGFGLSAELADAGERLDHYLFPSSQKNNTNCQSAESHNEYQSSIIKPIEMPGSNYSVDSEMEALKKRLSQSSNSEKSLYKEFFSEQSKKACEILEKYQSRQEENRNSKDTSLEPDNKDKDLFSEQERRHKDLLSEQERRHKDLLSEQERRHKDLFSEQERRYKDLFSEQENKYKELLSEKDNIIKELQNNYHQKESGKKQFLQEKKWEGLNMYIWKKQMRLSM